MIEASEPALELVLVRHGETEWTENGLLHGRIDVPLSAAGLEHAHQAASRLVGENFDIIYSSPLIRAWQTAEVIGAPLGLKPVSLEGLREMDFGWAEGKLLSHLHGQGSGLRLYSYFARLAMAATSERPNRFAARVKSALETIQSAYPQGRVLVVAHWGVLSMMIAILMDGNPSRWKGYGPWAPCGVTELHRYQNSWQLVCLNDHTHIHVNSSPESKQVEHQKG
jgi:broad specificity phosphatase PhoE